MCPMVCSLGVTMRLAYRKFPATVRCATCIVETYLRKSVGKYLIVLSAGSALRHAPTRLLTPWQDASCQPISPGGNRSVVLDAGGVFDKAEVSIAREPRRKQLRLWGELVGCGGHAGLVWVACLTAASVIMQVLHAPWYARFRLVVRRGEVGPTDRRQG